MLNSYLNKAFPIKLILMLMLAGLLSSCATRSVESYVKEADKLLTDNKSTDAIVLYQKAIKELPDEPVLYINQAALFRLAKKYTHAIHNYGVVLNSNPDSVWPYIGIARAYLDQEKYSQANEILIQGAERLPHNGAIDFYLGLTAFEMGKGNLALDFFNKSLDNKYPNLAKVYYYRGLTFQTLLSKMSRAKLDYESFLLSKSNDKKMSEDVKARLVDLTTSPYDF